ncbi:MAG: hypothetical protein IJC33_01390 [Clostridia bacterium]|nr:hypothetical protein [Clostridia bacterium]
MSVHADIEKTNDKHKAIEIILFTKTPTFDFIYLLKVYITLFVGANLHVAQTFVSIFDVGGLCLCQQKSRHREVTGRENLFCKILIVHQVDAVNDIVADPSIRNLHILHSV